MSDNHHNHADDFLMAFQDSCDKPALLLIHGFPLSSSLWNLQIDDLANFVRVIAPDLRGHGNADNVAGPYSMEILADDCADLMGYLNVASPFVVCGLSMGGYVAFEFYRRYREHIAGMILTATRAAADSDEGKANRDKMAEVAQRRGGKAIASAMLPKMFAPTAYENDPELVDYVRDMMEGTSVEGIVGALAAMKNRPDSTLTLAEIDVPVLVIHGEDDQLIPLGEAKEMAEALPNGRLVTIPNAGHLPNLEQSDAFNDAVIDFLESLALDDMVF
ncbi:MAG: alpha/beta fold hydrolase [Chloroflexi bacterium]|nr:alpha/beta fold hydrolase [Chloroflexota bacterium]